MQGVEGLAQGLQMAAVRDDGIAVVDASGVESRAESGKEPFDSFAGFCRDEKSVGVCRRYSIFDPAAGGYLRFGDTCIRAVAFIDDEQASLFGRNLYGGRYRAGRIDDLKYDLCAADHLLRAVDAHLFQAVGGIVQPGGVDEAEQNAVNIERLFDRVACGACDVGYQGPLFAQQTVQKGALPTLGSPTIATATPFLMVLPSLNESVRRVISLSMRCIISRRRARSAN